MPIYKAPVRDTCFVINELLHLASYGDMLGADNVSPDMVNAVIEEAGKFTSEVLAPLNASGDALTRIEAIAPFVRPGYMAND